MIGLGELQSKSELNGKLLLQREIEPRYHLGRPTIAWSRHCLLYPGFCNCFCLQCMNIEPGERLKNEPENLITVIKDNFQQFFM
jgi:hypothetical protein